MLSTIWSMRVAPQMAVETAGYAHAQASASCATVQSKSAAMGRCHHHNKPAEFSVLQKMSEALQG